MALHASGPIAIGLPKRTAHDDAESFQAAFLEEEQVEQSVLHFKEPGHSILKPHSPAPEENEEDDAQQTASGTGGRTESNPVSVLPNSKENKGAFDSASLTSLGTSPGTGSMADMWRLWVDDVEDGVEFPMIMPPARRSLSLKTKKTPPGTPSPKKMVRFADAMGLDLEKVRHFMKDQLPNTPVGVLGSAPVTTLTNELNRHLSGRYLTPSFPQPCLAGNFLERIRQQKVCLDSVQTQDFAVHAYVRVLNISFEKSLTVRYTFDNWRSSLDTLATYVPSSNDNFSDRFQFTLNAPPYLDIGGMLQLALCYRANDTEYWDNNYGQNYCLTCCAGAEGDAGIEEEDTSSY
ncbi:putative Protein phosphatase 1 regulatory subunit 3D [Hypsibius exemplaris]|uniref:CBM21 domain-containing protein n=1 Tax=Hypsibius exemplaris TaxID=2072580 RepID=A0A9X6NDD6_HYPEX|nr:putative Protein phosphatase 1 regulatory subunit 3D [Hypsibius exemplaris]